MPKLVPQIKKAIKKTIAFPTIPSFKETVGNFKTVFSAKTLKAAAKKQYDKIAKILDPSGIKEQLAGTKTGLIDSITPKQFKELSTAWREGTKLSRKDALTGALEQFTGVNLNEGLGTAIINKIKGEVGALKSTLQQTVLGCINKVVRDLMNKFPTLDFLINLEDRLNGILGKFRNQLEQSIDAELSKLMYNKIKIHQLTLFKQNIHGSIRAICPEATPASATEVQAFKDAWNEGKRKREEAYKTSVTTEAIQEEKFTPEDPGTQSQVREISGTVRRKILMDDEYANNLVAQNIDNIQGNLANSIIEGQTIEDHDVLGLTPVV